MVRDMLLLPDIHNCFQATDVQEVEVDFNPEFIQRLLHKLNWEVIRQACAQVRLSGHQTIEAPVGWLTMGIMRSLNISALY